MQTYLSFKRVWKVPSQILPLPLQDSPSYSSSLIWKSVSNGSFLALRDPRSSLGSEDADPTMDTFFHFHPRVVPYSEDP